MTRPRFRITLRTLLVMVTLAGCWLGWQVHILRNRSRIAQKIEGRGGRIWWDSRPSRIQGGHAWVSRDGFNEPPGKLFRVLIGDRDPNWIDLPKDYDDADRVEARSAFPSVTIMLER